MKKIVALDLFCGVGGLTHSFIQEGIDVVAGFDLDSSCKFPYEYNNSGEFILKDIAEILGKELLELYPTDCIKVLAGCAPCQPFSTYYRK